MKEAFCCWSVSTSVLEVDSPRAPRYQLPETHMHAEPKRDLCRALWADVADVEDHLCPTHRPQSSSFLGLPCRILNMNPQKELLWGLWVVLCPTLKSGWSGSEHPFKASTRFERHLMNMIKRWLLNPQVNQKPYPEHKTRGPKP